MHELEHPHRSRQVTKTVLTQPDQLNPARQRVPDQRLDRLRDQHLTAMTRRQQPRTTVQRLVHIPAISAQDAIARMQRHPRQQARDLGVVACRDAQLELQAGRDRIACGREHRDHPVAPMVDDRAARQLD